VAKPLVFVHGFACTQADWQPVAGHFAASHPVFTPDLRGHGATPARPEDCSIETYGADIAELLETRNLQDAVLIGHSMGCRVVLQAYLNAPARVAALALIDGSYRGGGGDPQAAAQAGRAAIEAVGYAEFQRRLFDGMFFAPSELARSTLARAMQLPESVGAALWPNVGRWDTAAMETALAAVKVPLLAIQCTSMGADGKRVALRAGESSPWLDLVRRQVPWARIEVLPGMSHFPQLEAPGEVNKLLSGFIRA